MLTVTEHFRQLAPEVKIGLLAMTGVQNPAQDERLEQRKQILEQELRRLYSGFDRPGLRNLPTLQAYHQFYRQFDKTYHIQLQLETIVFKNKSIPRVAALVEAMFMAELRNFLLTAGHDLDAVTGNLQAEVAQGGEQFIQLNGQEYTLKTGDLYIADSVGILSSVLSGPDQRTAIGPQTRRVAFTVYTPAGIEEDQVRKHLEDIETNIRLFSPAADTLLKAIYP
jgi:DNA/RNA-binding domain of Phe-tRNA-synthetase-like protein